MLPSMPRVWKNDGVEIIANDQGNRTEMLKQFKSFITYGPHKAVAEVSNHNEPIGRKSEIQLVRKSMDFTFSCFVLN